MLMPGLANQGRVNIQAISGLRRDGVETRRQVHCSAADHVPGQRPLVSMCVRPPDCEERLRDARKV